MRKIELFQIRKIYAIGGNLGITHLGKEDELHLFIERFTGKTSIKTLTYKEAQMIINELEVLQRKTFSIKQKICKKKQFEDRPGGITSGQKKKVWALMYELKKYDEIPNDVKLGDRLCAVIKKELMADATMKNPFAWITFEQGNRLIEVLKKYVVSAKKKGKVGV